MKTAEDAEDAKDIKVDARVFAGTRFVDALLSLASLAFPAVRG
jgi:hypothetical protein